MKGLTFNEWVVLTKHFGSETATKYREELDRELALINAAIDNFEALKNHKEYEITEWKYI